MRDAGARDGAAVRRAVERLFKEPPTTEAELEQRLRPLHRRRAVSAIVDLIQGRVLGDEDAEVLGAAIERLGVAGERGRLRRIAEDPGVPWEVRALAACALSAGDPDAVRDLVESLPPSEAERLGEQPLLRLLAASQRDEDAARRLAVLIAEVPVESSRAFLGKLERLRIGTGTRAAVAHRATLRHCAAPLLEPALLDVVVEEAGEDGLHLLEELRDSAPTARRRRELQRRVLEMRTREVSRPRPMPPPGEARVSACDGLGTFQLVGMVRHPDGSRGLVDLTLQCSGDVRGGCLLPRQRRAAYRRLVEQGETRTGAELVRVPLSEAARLALACATRATRARGGDVPAEARPAIALLERVAAREPARCVEPRAPRPTLRRARAALARPEHESWFFDLGDLAEAGVLPDRDEPVDAGWIDRAARGLDRPSSRRRVAAMARHVGRWHRWAGRAEDALLFFGLAREAREDFPRSRLVRVMLERSLRLLEHDAPAVLPLGRVRELGDPHQRALLRRLFFGRRRAPKGRDLARLDYTEAALASLARLSSTLPPELRPREDQLQDAAWHVGRLFADHLVGGQRDDDRLARAMVRALEGETRVPRAKALQLTALLARELVTFYRAACSACPVRCLQRPRGHFEREFHWPRHPAGAVDEAPSLHPEPTWPDPGPSTPH